MRTERNWTPRQMYVNSIAELEGNIDDFPTNYNWYGQDWDGPVAEEQENVVQVDETRNPLSETVYAELQDLIPNPAMESNDFGLQHYVQCRDFVFTHSDE